MLEKEINTIVELCHALQGEYASRFFEPVDEEVMKQWENENKIMYRFLFSSCHNKRSPMIYTLS
ncbi:MAG: hypothetical protein ACI4EF_04100 [Coprococcus sp.]